MKKSKCLLISAILGTLYLAYIIYYFINGVTSTSGSSFAKMKNAKAKDQSLAS